MRTNRSIAFTGATLFVLVCAHTALTACTSAVIEIGTVDGGEGDVDPSCVPSESEGAVGDACGVFVRLGGDDLAAGTKAEPVATIARALELAAGSTKTVYACGETFLGAIHVPAGMTVFGGLACASGWTYAGPAEPTVITALPDLIPLRLSAGSAPVHLEDIKVVAADASVVGGSSIGVLADSVAARLVRCSIEAGAAKNGQNGASGAGLGLPMPVDPSDWSIRGYDGVQACMGGIAGNLGGEAKVNELCPASIGGAGGKAMEGMGEKGGDGAKAPLPNPNNFGEGGQGGVNSGCANGANGANGEVGAAGQGGKGMGVITSSGYQGASGSPGLSGAPGQGGGGGGGAKGKTGCHGASGGGGGAGGCGGVGGLGGAAGGSSIAMISLGATLTLTDVTFIAGTAGSGGVGGTGQNGGVGGVGGLGGVGAFGPTPTTPACAGGGGGMGGFGGPGGGGQGGHSIGVAFLGAAPSLSGATILVAIAGAGGMGNSPVESGDSGVAAESMAFPE